MNNLNKLTELDVFIGNIYKAVVKKLNSANINLSIQPAIYYGGGNILMQSFKNPAHPEFIDGEKQMSFRIANNFEAVSVLKNGLEFLLADCGCGDRYIMFEVLEKTDQNSLIIYIGFPKNEDILFLPEADELPVKIDAFLVRVESQLSKRSAA